MLTDSRDWLDIVRGKASWSSNEQKGWIRSDVLELYLYLLCNRYHKASAAEIAPDFLRRLQNIKNGKDIFQYINRSKVIIQPFNANGNHWVVGVYVVDLHIGLFFDSTGGMLNFTEFQKYLKQIQSHEN